MKDKIILLSVLIICAPHLMAYVSINGINYDLDGDTAIVSYNRAYSGTNDLIIPSTVTFRSKNYTVTAIAPSAFYGCSNITSVSLPNSIKSIGMSAFEKCDGLTTINIPNTITSIESSTFAYCSALKSITIPNSVTTINKEAFYKCEKLTSLTIPSSVVSIGNESFRYCKGLTTLLIPNTNISIGKYAFSDCTSISSLNIPKNIKSIEYAFTNCTNLTTVVWNTVNIMNIGSIFDGCNNLQKITLTKDITQLPNSCFWGLEGLKTIIIQGPITFIGDGAFGNCKSLSSFTIPNSVTYLGKEAFQGCSSLQSITLPNSLDFISNSTFENCTSLSSIVIPNTVTWIFPSAFYNCTNLKSITLPTSTTLKLTIDRDAFANCTSLQSIIIPSHILSIESNAFANCINLKSVTIKCNGVPLTSPTAFNNTNSSIIFYVPCFALATFKKDDNYKKFTIKSYETDCIEGGNYYSIVLSPNTVSKGSTTGSGNYLEGASVTCTAIPATGYYFKYWAESVSPYNIVSYNNPFTFIANQSNCLSYPNLQNGLVGYRFLTAYFEEGTVPYTRTHVSPPYSEAFTSTQGNFTIQDVSLPSGFSSIWILDAAGKYGMVASASKSATKLYTSESWLISPFIEIPANSLCTLSFNHTAKFFSNKTNEMSLWVSSNYHEGKPSTGIWQQLTIPNYPTGNDWNFVKSGDIDLSQYAGQTITIAFKYVSTTSSAPKWEIKDFSVSCQYTDVPQIRWDKKAPRKILHNGQLFFLNSAGIFNSQGQKIK